LTLLGLIAMLIAARAVAQVPDGMPPLPQPPAPTMEQLPPAEQPPAVEQPQVPRVVASEDQPPGKLIDLNGEGDGEPAPVATLNDFLGYRYSASSLEWIPGSRDQFGMFSLAWDHYAKAGIGGELGIGMGFHFLNGPETTDMPPRLYDFSIGYQIRHKFGPFGFDLATAVKASSDFEGNARKGIRFPSHAVGFLTLQPELDLVFGVDFLDRDDIHLLPVAGLIWVPDPRMRFELVFPRPRAVFQLTDHARFYVSGELGGGTWAIERVSLENDLASYRDLRACIGLEFGKGQGRWTAFEFGYLFDRRLEYSSGNGNMRLDDALGLRLVTTY
jgi:hypothetical protein